MFFLFMWYPYACVLLSSTLLNYFGTSIFIFSRHLFHLICTLPSSLFIYTIYYTLDTYVRVILCSPFDLLKRDRFWFVVSCFCWFSTILAQGYCFSHALFYSLKHLREVNCRKHHLYSSSIYSLNSLNARVSLKKQRTPVPIGRLCILHVYRHLSVVEGYHL